tara:strand:+ start:89 stop:772 length:684 start_codon:yes stop_codon:yes gene_type:complete
MNLDETFANDVSQRVDIITPQNYGWLEYKLNSKELDHVWKCVDNLGRSNNEELAGNITASHELKDTNDWFSNNTILPLIEIYSKSFGNRGRMTPIFGRHPYTMSSWWVNYQKQHEFNPIHRHTGVYSFVIWLKIPFDWKDQNKDNITNTPTKSSFEFDYVNLLGESNSFLYNLNPTNEGMMLFFPSELRHQVYPFFNCNEDRISVSGNVYLDTNIDVPDSKTLYDAF